MLRLIETEFIKLRRRKLVWLMLPAALFMPFFALLYFKYVGQTGGDPIQFYRWSALGYTLWFILPLDLGTLCALLMYDENQNDMLKQLWIVPIGKMEYFFSKFYVVLIYSICFMLITAVASVMFSVLPGYVAFEWGSVLYLLEKCLEIGVLTPFVMLPILAIAASQKGYILPICITLIYVFLGFVMMAIDMYLHPLSSMAVIIMRNNDIPGIVLTQAIQLPVAFLCLFVWDTVSVCLAYIALRSRK